MGLLGNRSLRLTHKITALGIVGVAGVVLVGGMHMYADTEVATYRDAAESARAISELSGKIEIELLEGRRAEKDFLLRSEQKKAEAQEEIGKAVAAEINALIGRLQATGRADLVGEIEAMKGSLK
jgi:methyl-accepting chemotaxis protein